MESGGLNTLLEGPRKKLFGMVIFRIITITVLMGSTIVLNLRTGQSWTAVQQIILYSIGVIYLLSIFYLLAVKYNTSYRFQAVTQVFVDVLFWSCLIYVTGGLHSPFTFLYSLSIIHGSILLGKRGTYFTFALSFVCFMGVIWFESYGIFHEALGLHRSFNSVLDVRQVYQLFLNFCMLLLISVLAVYLAKELAEREEILSRERMSLRMQKMLNRSILTGITSGFVMMDTDGRVTFFNLAAERLSPGFDDKALGRPLADIMPQLEESITKELRGDKWSRYLEISLESEDESKPRWAGVNFSDMVGLENERMGSILMIEEISERKKLEERLLRHQKLAAVGEMAAGIAHEIRNPLASISGSIQILKSEFPPGDDNEKLMEIILRETDRLNLLIQDFLTFARPKPLSIAPVNVREIMEDITALLEQHDGLGAIRFRVEYAARLPELYGDSAQIRQLLWNVLKNAAEASVGSTPGVVWVRVERDAVGEDVRPGVRFEVRDNGEGMEKEVLDRIFDPFYTTKKSGTGLGMSILYQIVKGHGGLVEVVSEAGHGTTFSVVLPCEPDPNARQMIEGA